MIKYIYTLLILAGFATNAIGQQLAHSTYIDDTKHYWNPATTGTDHNIRTSIFFRQQWLGFSGAPRTGFVSVQYPFVDMNMAAGAIINFDQTGPVSKKGIQLTYAYKLRGIIGDESQLSLGINAGFQQLAFDPAGEIFNDSDDILLSGSSQSAFYPAVGVGAFFLSSTEEYKENVFFIGLAFRDAFTTDVLINDSNQARERHIHFNVGTRVYQRYSFIEPSITFNYVGPDNIDLRAGVRYEMEDSFWAGIGYSTLNEASFQGGIIVPEFGDRDGKLKVGLLANIGVTNSIKEFGPGISFYAGYLYDID